MKLKASKGRGWYVYKFGGGRDALLRGKDDDPFRAKLDLLSSDEIDELQKDLAVKSQGLDLVHAIRTEILEKRVLEVAGIEVELANGDVEKPVNGVQLFEALTADKGLAKAHEEIVAETIEALKDASVYERGELDRLRSRSDSSSATIASVSAGVATDAAR